MKKKVPLSGNFNNIKTSNIAESDQLLGSKSTTLMLCITVLSTDHSLIENSLSDIKPALFLQQNYGMQMNVMLHLLTDLRGLLTQGIINLKLFS